MSASLKKYFDYLDKISELSNKVASALQNYIAARTAIRDYVIRADEKHYTEVEQRAVLAIGALLDAESIVEEETADAIHQFLESVREWSAVAREVHDGFASYRETVQNNLLANFSAVTKAGNLLLQTHPLMATGMVNDVQIANVAIIGYLFNGENRLVEDAKHAFNSVRAEIDDLKDINKRANPVLQSFLASLDAYAASFHAAVDRRQTAYQLFDEKLAPLGAQIQDDFEEFHRWLSDIQQGIKDLKVLAEHGKKGFPLVH
jgi:hypothetical protein